MNILRRLFGREECTEKPSEAPGRKLQETSESNRALADDPVRFAEWVSQFGLRAIQPEKDLALCPSAEQCERLEITPTQRDACRREFSIMRALGVCMFVGRNLPPAYYRAFKAGICAETAQILYGVPTESRISEISSVIDQYLEDLESDSPTAFSLTYLERVYSGNPNQEGMFAVGLFQIPLQQAMTIFEAVRDGYCQLKFGLPFKAVEALEKGVGDESK